MASKTQVPPAITNVSVIKALVPLVGRQGLLDRIERSLENPAGRSRVVVLEGTMGIGKTRLATEIADRAKAHTSVVWWVNAEHIAGAKQALARLGESLHIPPMNDLDLTCEAVLARLEALRDYLLVFDNVEDAAGIASVLPNARTGSVLMTARSGVLNNDTRFRIVEVEPLAANAAVTLVDPDEISPRSDVLKLCDELGYLPQALLPARKAIFEGFGARRFIEELRRRSDDRSDSLATSTTIVSASRSVFSAIEIALNSLKEFDCRLFDFMCLCSFLGPGRLRSSFLTDTAVIELLPDSIRQLLSTDARFSSAMTYLGAAGLIDTRFDYVEVHRLTQHLLRASLGPAERTIWDGIATNLMLAVFPVLSRASLDTPRNAENLEHALTVGGCKLYGSEVSTDKAVLLNNCGIYLFMRGQYADSGAAFRRSAAIFRLKEGQSARYATAVSNFGLATLNTGRHELAGRQLERAVNIRKGLLSAGHPDIAAGYLNLGCWARESGDLHAAQTYFQRALEGYSGVRDSMPSGYAMAMNNLGVVRAQLRKGDAVETLRKALTAEQAAAGNARLELTINRNNLALALSIAGKDADSESMLKQALFDLRSTVSSDHPYCADLLNNLGLALRTQGKMHDAVAAFKEALQIEREFYGSAHAEVAATISNLGVTYRQMHRYVAAFRLHRQALEILEKVYGLDEHRRTAAAHGSYGNMLRRLGDLDGAITHHKRALAMELVLYPADDYELAGTYDNLGRALRHAGRLSEAIDSFEHALRIKRQSLSPDSDEIAKTLNNLGVAMRHLGEIERSVALHREALGIAEHIDANSRTTLYSLTNLGSSLSAMGRTAEADAVLSRTEIVEQKWAQ